MEKFSRMEKYKELRETIDSDAAAAGKPSINSVELQKQLRSLNEPQESSEASRHSRQTPRFSKEIDLQQSDDADEGSDQFHNEYLDDFINEVKEYNLEKGNRMSGNTQIDILLQLNKGKDRIQTAPPKAASAITEEDDEGVSYTQSLSSEQLQEEVDRLFEEDEQENAASARAELVEDIPEEEQPARPAQESFVFDGTPLVRINPIPPKEGQPLDESEEAEDVDVQATLNVPVEILEKNKPVEPAPGPVEPAPKAVKKEPAPKPEPRPQRQPEKPAAPKKEETKPKAKKDKEKQEKKPSSTSNKVLNVILLILILALIAVIAVTIYWLQQAGGF